MWLIFDNQTSFDIWHNQQMIEHPPADHITQTFSLPICLKDGRILTSVDDDFAKTSEIEITIEEKEFLLPSPSLAHLGISEAELLK